MKLRKKREKMQVIKNGTLKKFSDRSNYPGAVIIGGDVTKIGEYAFSECKNVTEVILSSSFEEIGDRAFANSYIQEIIIPKNVIFSEPLEHIGSFAFGMCKKLKHAPVLKTGAEIGKCAFMGCENSDYIKEYPDENGKSNRKHIMNPICLTEKSGMII